MANCLSNSCVGSFHNEMCNLFSPLPPEGKAAEVIKRISLAIISPLAYLVLGFVSVVGCLLPSRVNKDVFFVRFLNIQTNNPGVSDLKVGVKDDLEDNTKGYQKGACLYMPNSPQPLSFVELGVAFPFAMIIKPDVKLHYWSLADMDRNGNRQRHETTQKSGVKKYKPDVSVHHNAGINWKTIHFTGVDEFINKLKCIASATMAKKSTYETTKGKKKSLAEVKGGHNEGSITYNPEKDVVGILVRNTPKDIKLAKDFQENYKDSKGNKVFKNVFLACQDAKGNILKI